MRAHNLKSSKGFSLIEVAVSVAILAIAMMGVLHLMQVQFRSQKTMDILAKDKEFTGELTRALSDPEMCTALFPPNQPVQQGVENPIASLKMPSGDTINPGVTDRSDRTVDGYYDDDIFVTELEFNEVAQLLDGAGGPISGRYKGRLEVTYDRVGAVMGSNSRKRFFYIFFNDTANAGVFEACTNITDTNDSALCTVMGGDWNGTSCNMERRNCLDVGGTWGGNSCNLACVTCEQSGGTCVPDGAYTICNMCDVLGLAAFDPVTKKCGSPVVQTTTYYWEAGAWGPCEEGGSKTRYVVCKDNLGDVTADSNCPGTKPTEITNCVYATYQWLIGGWSACDGANQRSRSVDCVDQSSSIVADNLCIDNGAGAKPDVNENCPVVPVYRWVYGPTQACGTDSYRPRTVVCVDENDVVVADLNCSGQTKPSSSSVPCCPGNDDGSLRSACLSQNNTGSDNPGDYFWADAPICKCQYNSFQ